MRIPMVGVALLLAGLGQLRATDYYVDYVGGSDFNSGTSPKSPWQHCPGDSAAGGNVAGSPLFPGDTIFFKGGVTYVFTGPSGIALHWSGAPGAPITYDGNSAGNWGEGRATFTDEHSARGITALHAVVRVQHLAFRSLEFARIGGAPALPYDASAPVAPNFGGGIAFNAGADDVLIDGCGFRELGYWFNQKPMSAASIRGTAISSNGATGLRIAHCDFSRVAIGCDFSGAGPFGQIEITQCSFRDAIVWPVNLPPDSSRSADAITVGESTFLEDNFFTDVSWQGYGYNPKTEVVDVEPGATLSFAAAAIASPSASYQWHKNGVPIPGETGVVFSLNAVSAADSGVYSAVASNSAGSATSNPAVVVMTGIVSELVAPVITQEPADIEAPLYSNVAFSVAATGVPAPAFQWYRNGEPIDGATDAVLSLWSVTSSDVYSVVVSNAAGWIASRTASLRLIEKAPANTAIVPEFTTQPTDQIAALYGSVTFSATASGFPEPSYQWRRNGMEIAGATDAWLTLPQVTFDDAGGYSVVAWNLAGWIESNEVNLLIVAAPEFTSQPVSQTVAAGSSVTFTASASGWPAPAYQWRKNGVDFPGATNSTLRLEGVTKNDEATYSVVAQSAAGFAVSDNAVLLVQDIYVPPPEPSPPPPPPPSDTKTGVVQRVNDLLSLEAGGMLYVGFEIKGDAPKKILVRAVGPTLGTLGVAGALADPQISLYYGTIFVNWNDNWGGGADLMDAFSQAGATPFVSWDSGDSAILMTVPPGTITVAVSAANGLGGMVLVEAYEFP